MTAIKPITALAIVFFGQSNLVSQNYFSSIEKIKQVYFQPLDKMKLDKDDKKISRLKSQKQTVAKFRDNAKVGLKKLPQIAQQKDVQFSKTPFDSIPKFRESTLPDFNSFRLVWFGCCMQIS
jgi:hypothetical protein